MTKNFSLSVNFCAIENHTATLLITIQTRTSLSWVAGKSQLTLVSHTELVLFTLVECLSFGLLFLQ